MQLTDLDRDDVFDLLSSAADQDYENRDNDVDVLGPEDEEEDSEDIEYELQDTGNDEDRPPVHEIVVSIDNTRSEDDEDSTTENGLDTSDLEEGIKALNDITEQNQALLESIDDTLENQFNAEERQRRKDAIITEESSPFSSLIASGDFENQPSSEGGLFDGLRDTLGLGGGGDAGKGKKGKPAEGPDSKKPGRFKRLMSNIGGNKGKMLTGLIATGLAIAAVDSVASKLGSESLLDTAGNLVGDKDDVMNADNATVPKAVYTENNAVENKVVENAQTSSEEEINDSDFATNRTEQSTFSNVINNETNSNTYAVPEALSPDSNIVTTAATVGAMGLGYMGTKSIAKRAPTPPVLNTTVPASAVLEAGSNAPSKSLFGKVKGLPLIGSLINTAMLGADVMTQRDQEYDTDLDKNKDTAKLVGSWGADTVAAMAGAKAGAAVGAAMGSVVPVIGNIVGAGIGSLAGGAAAYFASSELGFSEMVGDAASTVYGAAAEAVTSVNSMFDSVSDFFISEQEISTEEALAQKDVYKELKADIEKPTFGTGGFFSNMFGGNSSTSSVDTSVLTAPRTSSNVTATVGPTASVSTQSNHYKVSSDNEISVPTPVYEPPEETLTAANVENIINNTYNQQKAPPRANGASIVRKDKANIEKPENNSYASQKPSLTTTPLYIDDATLGLINVGYV